MKKLTKEEFIRKAREVHGWKYDYSKVNYINANEKVCIICPEHGEFWQTPGNHLYGQGCKFCNNKKRIFNRTKKIDVFINECKQKFGNKYDYSKVEYKNTDTKVCIICPEHGEFWQTPYHHLNSKIGCPVCCGNSFKGTEQFIKEAKEIHGDKYDYSKVNYINANEKVCIICPEHGEFWQTPSSHINNKCGCPKCVGKNKTTESFIKECKEIFGEKYSFKNTIYNGAFNYVTITCKNHGDFITTPHSLLSSHAGCTKCAAEISADRQRKSLAQFITDSQKIHGNKYDYSKVQYVNAHTPVSIICPTHGEFQITPNAHLSKQIGCPKCSETLIEKEIRLLCEERKVLYEKEKKFPWLKNKGLLRIDYFLPEYNIAIECQGEYHFMNCNKISNKEQQNCSLEAQIKKDKLKYKLLSEHNIKLYYYVPKHLKKYAGLLMYNENIYFSPQEIFDSFMKKES